MMHRHTFSRVFLYVVISTGIWFSYSVSAFSILEMLGIETDDSEEAKKAFYAELQNRQKVHKIIKTESGRFC